MSKSSKKVSRMTKEQALQLVIKTAIKNKCEVRKGKISIDDARIQWHLNNNIINAVRGTGASKKKFKKKDC